MNFEQLFLSSYTKNYYLNILPPSWLNMLILLIWVKVKKSHVWLLTVNYRKLQYHISNLYKQETLITLLILHLQKPHNFVTRIPAKLELKSQFIKICTFLQYINTVNHSIWWTEVCNCRCNFELISSQVKQLIIYL